MKTQPSPIAPFGAFAGVSRTAWSELLACGRRRDWTRDETIFPTWDPPPVLHVILEGLAGMIAVTPNGYERILGLYRPGEVIGARTLLPGRSRTQHEIRALTDAATIEIPRDDLERIGERHPEILIDLSKAFSRQIADLGRRLMGVMSFEVRVRLARLLLDLTADEKGEGDEPVPLAWPLTHREIAQIVGASRPHVSTLLGDLEAEGVVERRGQKRLLVRPARLAEIAGQS